jgi:hypothetical protein
MGIKKQYIIKLEAICPVEFEFETLAEDEHEALKNLDKPSLLKLRVQPRIDQARIMRKRVSIKEKMTSIIKLLKSF